MKVMWQSRHPDKNPGNEEEAKVKFQQVHASYQCLMKGGDDDSDGDETYTDDGFEAAASFFHFMCVLGNLCHSLLQKATEHSLDIQRPMTVDCKRSAMPM